MKERYALVFIYNGDFSKATYLCGPEYEEGDIVIVNYVHKHYAGRILEISKRRPSDIPKDVVFKKILIHFKMGYETKLDYWNPQIDLAVRRSLEGTD